MNTENRTIRRAFVRYGKLCLVAGLVILALLALLRLLNWLIDWQAPFDPMDLMYFATGLIVVVISLGPYVATVGELAKVAKLQANPRPEAPSSPRTQLIIRVGLAAVVLFFAVLIILSRNFMVWLTFGGLLSLMGLTFFYLAWRIGGIERAGKIVIYQTDYSWRFDRFNYVGVYHKVTK
jgi:predicted membrane channel-forming protein YqfA (hemolysin III family)